MRKHYNPKSFLDFKLQSELRGRVLGRRPFELEGRILMS